MRSTDDYADLRARLVRWVRKLCASRHADRAEDIVQQAVLRVMAVKQRDAARELNASYLWRVAYSATVDEIRGVRSEEAFADDAACAAPDPEQRAASRELGDAIRECMDELAHDRRRAVTLYLAGHSVPESAGLLSWDAKRVENLVYRGLADLRESLRARGFAPV